MFKGGSTPGTFSGKNRLRIFETNISTFTKVKEEKLCGRIAQRTEEFF